MTEPFSHLDDRGQANMVDVTDKPDTDRLAVAEGYVRMQPETLRRIVEGEQAKGDVLAVARIAGIQAAKDTSRLIPLCHTLLLSSVKLAFPPRRTACASKRAVAPAPAPALKWRR